MKCSFPLVFRLLFFALFASGIPLSPLFTEDASDVMTDNQPAAIQSRAIPTKGTATYDTSKIDILVCNPKELKLFEFPWNAVTPDYGELIAYMKGQTVPLNILIFAFGPGKEILKTVSRMESEVRYYFGFLGHTIKSFSYLPSMAKAHHLKEGDKIDISVMFSTKEPVIQFVLGGSPYDLDLP